MIHSLIAAGMLLFFFMVTTVLRESTIMVKQSIPKATQLRKMSQKKLVSYMYVGKPNDAKKFGTEPKIQANDAFIQIDGIIQFLCCDFVLFSGK